MRFASKIKPNQQDAVNPANASRFAVVHHWRGVTDPGRCEIMRSSDTIYLCLLLVFCVTFVPVWLYFGISESIVPLSAILFDRAARILGYLPPAQSHLGVVLYCLFYLSSFLAVSYYATTLTSKMTGITICLVRTALCALVISLSFLPVITYSSLGGRGGTYTFWTAIPRYLDRQTHYK